MPRIAVALAMAASLAAVTPAAADDDDWRDNPKILACSPHVLKTGGAVTLLLGPNHGAELAIRRAGTRDWYFLVVGGTAEKDLLMPSKAFRAARQVRLPQTVQGLADSGKRERVFSRPGRYTVYISDKLESEAGGNICSIDYRR
jgi:hypothetical protein